MKILAKKAIDEFEDLEEYYSKATKPKINSKTNPEYYEVTQEIDGTRLMTDQVKELSSALESRGYDVQIISSDELYVSSPEIFSARIDVKYTIAQIEDNGTKEFLVGKKRKKSVEVPVRVYQEFAKVKGYLEFERPEPEIKGVLEALVELGYESSVTTTKEEIVSAMKKGDTKTIKKYGADGPISGFFEGLGL